MKNFLPEPIAAAIWDAKYRYRENGVVHDRCIEDTWRRVSRAVAAVETARVADWEGQFYALLEDFRFLPGGRILAGAGTHRNLTLFNCFVMGEIDDSVGGIFESLKQSALTLQQGGGIGLDFSTLRPRGMMARGVGVAASGPLSFMQVWDSMCATVLSTGSRRGAMMATLRCDHPDIEEFVEAKRSGAVLHHFNLSVLVSDALIEAVEQDAEWPLVFPLLPGEEADGHIVERRWSGMVHTRPCRVIRKIGARSLWHKIMAAAYHCAEPGVIFIDRVNRDNNLAYRENLSTTNPCGEIPLPPYGACNLGSINLTRFVCHPFTTRAQLDLAAIDAVVTLAVRLLDNVYEVSSFPLPQQAETARATRRIGLGITGLADALIMLGMRYGGEASLRLAGEMMACIAHAAYRSSIALAREKGPFPALDIKKYLRGEFVRKLPEDIRQGIERHGIRNSHLIAIAPAGTISLLAGNVSSGLEPVFDWCYQRTVRGLDGNLLRYEVRDDAYLRFIERHGASAPLTPAFVRAAELPTSVHLAMQAVLQEHVDNAISKTVNVAPEIDFETFRGLYRQAYDKGLKGCTIFRPNAVTGQVLVGGQGNPCCNGEHDMDWHPGGVPQGRIIG